MIIDVHYHFMRLPPDDTAARNMLSSLLEDARRTGYAKPLDEVLPAYRDIMDDVECDKLVKRMEQSGVDVTAINVVDNYALGVATDRMMRVNEIVAKAAAKHPGKLISLAGIDPRRPEAPTLLRRCLAEFKMNGLKWHPDNGYYPNSQEAYAMLEVLNEFGYPCSRTAVLCRTPRRSSPTPCTSMTLPSISPTWKSSRHTWVTSGGTTGQHWHNSRKTSTVTWQCGSLLQLRDRPFSAATCERLSTT